VLERRAPPTFDVLIEIQERDRVAVHVDVAEAVDALLRGYPLPPEIRYRDEKGNIQMEKTSAAPHVPLAQQGLRRQTASQPERIGREERVGAAEVDFSSGEKTRLRPVRVYPYGVARNRLLQAARRLSVPAQVVDTPGEADVLVTLRAYYRKRQRPIVDAEQRGMPVYVLKANTAGQLQQFLSDLFNLSAIPPEDYSEEPVLHETQAAIDAVLNGERYVELPPATAYIRRLQHEMVRQANLTSHSYGKEPNRRVRIYRE